MVKTRNFSKRDKLNFLLEYCIYKRNINSNSICLSPLQFGTVFMQIDLLNLIRASHISKLLISSFWTPSLLVSSVSIRIVLNISAIRIIKNVLFNLWNLNKTPGKDFLAPELLRTPIDWWAPLLAGLFSCINNTDCIPVGWEDAIIFSLYKKGDKGDQKL